jgi:hypothetical protein
MFKRIEYSSVELKKGTYYKRDILNLKKKILKIGKVTISCPQCNKQGDIKIPMEKFAFITNVLKVVVPFGWICDHSFTLFVDKDLNIRGKEPNDIIIS